MKKTILLLGAGFSYDLGMPLAKELTEIFLSVYNNNFINSFVNIISRQNPFGNDRPINEKAIKQGLKLIKEYKKDNGDNYEFILSQIENYNSVNQSDKDSFHYLFALFYEQIHETLTTLQILSYDLVYKNNSKWFSNIVNILNKQETWIFNLNHDLYIECLAADNDIPITYGDSYNIHFPLSNYQMEHKVELTYSKRDDLCKDNIGFFKNQYGINLVKPHGGLSELLYEDKKKICNLKLDVKDSHDIIEQFKKINNMAFYNNGNKRPSGRAMTITNSEGDLDIISKSMLTGGNKYSKTINNKPGEEKLKLFEDVLLDSDEILVIGYSYSDKHINNRILNAMVKNSKLQIRTIDPSGLLKPDFLEQFDYDMRINSATCSTAQWLDYCVSNKWNKEITNSINENNKMREVIFSTMKKMIVEKNSLL